MSLIEAVTIPKWGMTTANGIDAFIASDAFGTAVAVQQWVS